MRPWRIYVHSLFIDWLRYALFGTFQTLFWWVCFRDKKPTDSAFFFRNKYFVINGEVEVPRGDHSIADPSPEVVDAAKKLIDGRVKWVTVLIHKISYACSRQARPPTIGLDMLVPHTSYSIFLSWQEPRVPLAWVTSRRLRECSGAGRW